MHWWFQLFREYGDPIQYGPQHTPVTIDPYISTIAFGFTVPVISYLLILPGIKFKKVHSSMSFLFCMLVGATILISLYHPCWNKAEARIVSLYKACSTERLGANLLVRVGLHHVNITMDTEPIVINGTLIEAAMHFNEKVELPGIHRMKEELPKALRKGLPYPILKVIEYISNDAFGWGKQYRHVGYYTSSALWTAVGFWVMSIVSLGFLPQYYSRTILSTGIVTVVGDLIFFINNPTGMIIKCPTEEGYTLLIFNVSRCFYATSIVGIVCIHVGYFMLIWEWRNGFYLDTIFTAQRRTTHNVINGNAIPGSPHLFLTKRTHSQPTLEFRFLTCIHESM